MTVKSTLLNSLLVLSAVVVLIRCVGKIACGSGEHLFVDKCVNECPRGTWINKTADYEDCLWCSPGTYQEKSAEETCDKCIKGTYSNTNGSTACTPCSKGSYQDNQMAVQCKPCPIGTHPEYNEKSTKCIACPVGYNQSSEGQSGCSKCGINTYNNEVGAAFCKKCESNTYQDETGKSSCKPCPDEQDESKVPDQCNWKECPKGYVKKVVDGHKTQCVICPLGTYQPDEDGKECLKCPQGYYNNRRGSIRCRECPANSWTPAEGMKSFYDCYGPSIQLFNDEHRQERYIVAYSNQTPPFVPIGFKLEFKYARVLSGIWQIKNRNGKWGEGELIKTNTAFILADLKPQINNVFCYIPGYVSDFIGKINKTSTGEYCGRWDETGADPDNYCRKEANYKGYPAPSGEHLQPWCLTEKSRVSVVCGVPVCGWDTLCKTRDAGGSYRGSVSSTTLGYTCRKWWSDWPHPNTDYANEAYYGVGDHNKCRNPDPSYPTLFCYTTNWLKRTDDCNIPLCDPAKHDRYIFK